MTNMTKTERTELFLRVIETVCQEFDVDSADVIRGTRSRGNVHKAKYFSVLFLREFASLTEIAGVLSVHCHTSMGNGADTMVLKINSDKYLMRSYVSLADDLGLNPPLTVRKKRRYRRMTGVI